MHLEEGSVKRNLLEGMATTLVFLPGESEWTEKPGGPQSTGLQRVGHNLATKHRVSLASVVTGKPGFRKNGERNISPVRNLRLLG